MTAKLRKENFLR